MCTGDLWAVDRAGVRDWIRSLEIIENDTVKKWTVGFSLIFLKWFAQIIKTNHSTSPFMAQIRVNNNS